MPDEPGAYAPSNGIQLWYRDEGDSSGDPLLLIMGLSSQLIAWPEDFVADLGRRGYRVIRFDNRDCGLSTKMDGQPARLLEVDKNPRAAAYKLEDMAADAVGLLEYLGIERAHVVGASMGGMIAQLIAINSSQRVRSLCSIMSTTGNLLVGWPTPEAIAALIVPTPPERDAAIEHVANVMRVVGSKTLEAEEEESRRELAAASYDRMFYPEGGQRQLAAIFAARDRTSKLREVTTPTLVIHGGEDSLINISGGKATHEAIWGSEYLPLGTMGHDLPRSLRGEIAAAIDTAARKALASSAPGRDQKYTDRQKSSDRPPASS